MKKSDRKSKNVEIKKKKPILSEFKNIEIRKPVQDVMDGSERWASTETSPVVSKNYQKLVAETSDHLRDRKPIAKQERNVDDLLSNAAVTDALERNPVHATRNFRTFREGNKPQHIQVTPGKWNTKK